MTIARRIIILLVVATQLSAQLVVAAEPVRSQGVPRAIVQDVRLQGSQQTLETVVVTPEGTPLAGQQVMLARGSQILGSSVTDAQGRIRMRGVRGGNYQLISNNQTVNVRAWTQNAAPPVATNQVRICPQQPVVVVRPYNPLRTLFGCEPMMLGVLVAAAIAVPIAVHDSSSGGNERVQGS